MKLEATDDKNNPLLRKEMDMLLNDRLSSNIAFMVSVFLVIISDLSFWSWWLGMELLGTLKANHPYGEWLRVGL